MQTSDIPALSAATSSAATATRVASGFETTRLWHYRLARTALRSGASASFGHGGRYARAAWPAALSATASRSAHTTAPSCDIRHEAGNRHAA